MAKAFRRKLVEMSEVFKEKLVEMLGTKRVEPTKTTPLEFGGDGKSTSEKISGDGETIFQKLGEMTKRGTLWENWCQTTKIGRGVKTTKKSSEKNAKTSLRKLVEISKEQPRFLSPLLIIDLLKTKVSQH